MCSAAISTRIASDSRLLRNSGPVLVLKQSPETKKSPLTIMVNGRFERGSFKLSKGKEVSSKGTPVDLDRKRVGQEL